MFVYYNTNSNKLLKVVDAISADNKLGDFYNGSSGSGNDYAYDANGNLITDANKKISSITYNYLNLPSVITVTGKGTITYTYDAAGSRLKKVTVDNTVSPSKTTTTLYIGGTVYVDDTLQFIAHEEGRIRPVRDASGNITSFSYDYFLKDHLGNVRMVLTEEQKVDRYPTATLEGTGTGSPLSHEEDYYDINESYVVDKPTTVTPANLLDYINDNGTNNPNTFGNKNAESEKMYRLNAATNRNGLGRILKVMAGDKIDILAKSYYHYNSGTIPKNNLLAADIISAFIGVTGGGNPAVQHGATTTVLNNNNTGLVVPLGDFSNNNPDNINNHVKAGLSYVILDERFNYVTGGYDPVSTNASGGLKSHFIQNIVIPKNGYIYIYCSNESNIDVFFDNLEVVDTRGPILEETHYYPFGLTMAGISSKALNGTPENKYKYNKGCELQSNEFSDGSGLEFYATEFRSLDPQLGRWWQIDPKPDMNLSLYSSVGNNPILNNDPLGDTVNLGNLYEKGKNGSYLNIKEIIAFELFSSTKEGKKYLLDHAQKGFTLKGVFVKGLNIKAGKEGKLDKKGIDIGLNVVNHIADGVAMTSDRIDNGRLKISFSMERSENGPSPNNDLSWRDNMLGRVDSWAHEFYLHGDLVEKQFLSGSKIDPYSHDFPNLTASKYGGENSGWRNSTGLKILQEVQNMPLNMNHGLQPHSDLYLWDKVMMPGLNYLVPLNAPKY